MTDGDGQTTISRQRDVRSKCGLSRSNRRRTADVHRAPDGAVAASLLLL
jgi:hypothetical protein